MTLAKCIATFSIRSLSGFRRGIGTILPVNRPTVCWTSNRCFRLISGSCTDDASHGNVADSAPSWIQSEHKDSPLSSSCSSNVDSEASSCVSDKTQASSIQSANLSFYLYRPLRHNDTDNASFGSPHSAIPPVTSKSKSPYRIEDAVVFPPSFLKTEKICPPELLTSRAIASAWRTVLIQVDANVSLEISSHGSKKKSKRRYLTNPEKVVLDELVTKAVCNGDLDSSYAQLLRSCRNMSPLTLLKLGLTADEMLAKPELFINALTRGRADTAARIIVRGERVTTEEMEQEFRKYEERYPSSYEDAQAAVTSELDMTMSELKSRLGNMRRYYDSTKCLNRLLEMIRLCRYAGLSRSLIRERLLWAVRDCLLNFAHRFMWFHSNGVSVRDMERQLVIMGVFSKSATLKHFKPVLIKESPYCPKFMAHHVGGGLFDPVVDDRDVHSSPGHHKLGIYSLLYEHPQVIRENMERLKVLGFNNEDIHDAILILLYPSDKVEEMLAVVDAELSEDADNRSELEYADREHSISDREHSIADQEHSISDREHSIADQEHSISDREHSIADQEHSILDRENSIADQEHSISDRSNSNTDKEHSTDDREHSISGREHAIADRKHLIAHQANSIADRDNSNTDREQSIVDREHSCIAKAEISEVEKISESRVVCETDRVHSSSRLAESCCVPSMKARERYLARRRSSQSRRLLLTFYYLEKGTNFRETRKYN